MTRTFIFHVVFGNVLGYAQTVERILKEYDEDPNRFADMTTKGAAFIAENYSQERERESILFCWNRILG